MILRKYQTAAVNAVWEALRRGADSVVSLPTGSGKALVVAELSRLIIANGGRVLIATHVAELVSQNAKEFQTLTGIEPGILCAGLERTDKGHNVLFASVQSLYQPAQRGEIEPFDLILIDEAHLVADKKSEAKFYPTLFKCFPDARRVGLSATPFRMDGVIYGEGKYFSELCYEANVLDLVRDGYLAPLVGVNAALTLDTKKLKKVAGDYDLRTVEELETDSWLLAVAESVKELGNGRKHIAVFCPTVATAERASAVFTSIGLCSSHVVGDTEDRSGRLDSWKAGEFPVMCSVNVLTTGFNFRALDCIVCIRPTTSPGLWIQTLGRGTRTWEGKKNCLVLDYSGNLAQHGGIAAGMEEAYTQVSDGVIKVSAKPRKVSENKRKVKAGNELTDLDPMLASPGGARVTVGSVSYVVIGSKTQPGKSILMVSYDCKMNGGAWITASNFICVEYTGYARAQAEEWFSRRQATAPRSAEEAQTRCWGLPTPREITLKKNGRYWNVLKEHF